MGFNPCRLFSRQRTMLLALPWHRRLCSIMKVLLASWIIQQIFQVKTRGPPAFRVLRHASRYSTQDRPSIEQPTIWGWRVQFRKYLLEVVES